VIKLLIDECLTPDLVDTARARWIEADHLVNQLIEIEDGGRVYATAWPSTQS